MSRRPGDGQALERQAQAVHLFQVCSRQARHHGTAVAAQQHQAFLLQLEQRLAHRAAADLMTGCDLDLAQALTRREVALQNSLAQTRTDGRRQGSAIWRCGRGGQTLAAIGSRWCFWSIASMAATSASATAIHGSAGMLRARPSDAHAAYRPGSPTLFVLSLIHI